MLDVRKQKGRLARSKSFPGTTRSNMSRKIGNLSIRTATRLSATGIAGIVATAGCGGAPTEFEPLQEVNQQVTPNPGSTQVASVEPTNFVGAHPEVMLSTSGCTGTVIGPYAVLGAKHCVSSGSVSWAGSGVTLPVAMSHVNPYTVHEGANVFTPDWWITLNNAQKAAPGGRQDDWPAQHDQAVMFVPSLTPSFLYALSITPALVAPGSVGTTNFRIVGVGSTGPTGPTRMYMATGFIPSNPNTITVGPRDGYLGRSTAANFAYADGGDSGGPNFWLDVQPWVNGTSYVARKVLVGTTHNGKSPGGDLAPLAYNPGITMTANQLLTARLNSLWVAALADDADGDGIPYDCDNNPAVASASDNTCPTASIGGPSGTNVRDKPAALLQCRPGYVPAGLSGRFGDLIDQLSLRCVAYSCFDRPETCGDAYITDAFGGNGGGPLSQACANDSVLVGITGKQSGTGISSIAGTCAPMARIRSNEVDTFTTTLPVMGTGSTGTPYGQSCKRRDSLHDSWLNGFQARTTDKRWVTGLHPFCDEKSHHAAPYVGGTGGYMTFQKCPLGHVAVGTVQRDEGGAVNVFGLLCAVQGNVVAGDPPIDSELTVVRTSFADYATGIIVSHGVERLTSAHLPTAGTNRVKCSPGYAMTGVTVAHDGLIKRVVSFTCKDIRPGQSGTQTQTVNVGGSGGTVASSTCPFGGLANGLYARSGWFADGVAMSCTDF
jgi:hypothetical protein